MSIDDEWTNYLKNTTKEDKPQKKTLKIIEESESHIPLVRPPCDPLYISTKTKVLFLNQPIDTHDIFWRIPITEYWKPEECIIKKQMKIVSKSKEEFEVYQQRLLNVPYYMENVMNQIDNPTARRIKFKDERKITVGISKKDIMNCRGKVKHAFYNCFAIILRFRDADTQNFREIHVKVFNTGKMEIPGILNQGILTKVKEMILEYIGPHTKEPLAFKEDNKQNVLINSNFNCGYFINREELYAILKSSTYAIETAYDPCSYPGVKCKFYFNNERGFDKDIQRGHIQEADKGMKMSELIANKKYTEISFMIFRTGSCLIVGNCDEDILEFVYQYIKTLLYDQYERICVWNEVATEKTKKTKVRKRVVYVNA